MKLWTCVTIIACKLARFILRKLGRGGTSIPGIIAKKMHPKILKDLSQGVNIILVTGTNGKTTICRMIEQILTEANLPYFSNKTGANLETGITAEFIMNSSLKGRCKYKYAVIECDELAFRRVSKNCDIKCVVVSNLFRDQLDRFGEISHTLDAICDGIRNVPKATVCVNADCSICSTIAEKVDNEIVFFGLNCPIYSEKADEVSDAKYCLKCGEEYKYDYVTYGHLGGFYCEKCGYKRTAPQVAVEEIIETTVDYSKVMLNIGGEKIETIINLPGGYNIYNAASSASAGFVLGIDAKTILSALGSFSCGFGRMEKFQLGKSKSRMILVKNPAGVNQVLTFLYNVKEPSVFVVGINDKEGDGTDVSWIWDADFEKLLSMGDNLKEVIATGARSAEMAVRFKYAGLPEGKIKIMNDYGELLSYISQSEEDSYIMPNYTAMLEIRDKISKDFGYDQFWQ